jgi:FG-GAP repeat protein
VALAGDGQTALVGAYSGNGLSGIVYSYSRRGGSYVLDGQITAPDGAPGDEFGASVSLSGLGNSR